MKLKILITSIALGLSIQVNAACYSNMDCPVGYTCQGRIGSSVRICIGSVVPSTNDRNFESSDSRECRSNIDCRFGQTCSASWGQVGVCN